MHIIFFMRNYLSNCFRQAYDPSSCHSRYFNPYWKQFIPPPEKHPSLTECFIFAHSNIFTTLCSPPLTVLKFNPLKNCVTFFIAYVIPCIVSSTLKFVHLCAKILPLLYQLGDNQRRQCLRAKSFERMVVQISRIFMH